MKKMYILIGPPGAGKGTHASFLQKKLNTKLIQPGAMLRQEISKRSKIGRIASPYVKQGLLAPDRLVNELIFNIVERTRKDILFDGFPRSVFQARELEKIILQKKVKLTLIELQVDSKIIYERIGGRRSCSCGETYHVKYKPPKKNNICDKCGKKLFIRHDSKPQVIKQRIKIYKKQTQPVLNFFSKKNYCRHIKIDGNKSIESVQKQLVKKLT